MLDAQESDADTCPDTGSCTKTQEPQIHGAGGHLHPEIKSDPDHHLAVAWGDAPQQISSIPVFGLGVGTLAIQLGSMQISSLHCYSSMLPLRGSMNHLCTLLHLFYSISSY